MGEAEVNAPQDVAPSCPPVPGTEDTRGVVAPTGGDAAPEQDEASEQALRNRLLSQQDSKNAPQQTPPLIDGNALEQGGGPSTETKPDGGTTDSKGDGRH